MEQKRSKFDEFTRRPVAKVYILLVVSLVLAGIFLGNHLRKPRIKGAEDLVTIQGTISKKWYAEMGDGGLDLTFLANEYTAAFKFHGKFFGFSYMHRFLNEVEEGDLIRMRIPKYEFGKLTAAYGIIYPVGIWDDEYEYIEKEKALERELMPADLYMGLGALGAALLFWYIIRLMEKRRTPSLT